MPQEPVARHDLEVAMAVRAELGAGSDEAAIGVFLERVQSSIDARVDARVAERTAGLPARRTGDYSPVLAILSLVVGIPITAIASAFNGAEGVVVAIVAWVVIGVVNVAHARR